MMIAICHALNMLPRLVGWDLTQIRSRRSCKLIRYQEHQPF